jgi:Na+/H+ antiporter NhaA
LLAAYASSGPALADSVTLGIVVGLVVGKSVRVFGSTWLVQKVTGARFAEGTSCGTFSAWRCSAGSGSRCRS